MDKDTPNQSLESLPSTKCQRNIEHRQVFKEWQVQNPDLQQRRVFSASGRGKNHSESKKIAADDS